jgi:hypothetical protein
MKTELRDDSRMDASSQTSNGSQAAEAARRKWPVEDRLRMVQGVVRPPILEIGGPLPRRNTLGAVLLSGLGKNLVGKSKEASSRSCIADWYRALDTGKPSERSRIGFVD